MNDTERIKNLLSFQEYDERCPICGHDHYESHENIDELAEKIMRCGEFTEKGDDHDQELS